MKSQHFTAAICMLSALALGSPQALAQSAKDPLEIVEMGSFHVGWTCNGFVPVT